MLFSQKECDLLLKSLTAYLADGDMHTDFGGAVVSSAIHKLKNINAMTVFNQKELSAMCTSLYYIEEAYLNGNLGKLPGFVNVLPGGFYPLMQKTEKLYDAQKRSYSH